MKRSSRKTPAAKQSPAGKLGPLARTWTPEQHEAAQITAWANTLLGIPLGAKDSLAKATSPLRPLFMGDAERIRIAAFLHRLASTHAALEALHGRRRGRPAGLDQDYRIALDYLATYERLGKSEAAVSEVRKAWSASRSKVLAAHQRCKDAAERELRRLEHQNSAMTRGDLLQAVSDELRAAIPAQSKKVRRINRTR